MVLITHIIIALFSMAQSVAILKNPSPRKFHLSYALVVLTIASGTYLVMQSPAHLTSSCLAGLAYLTFIAMMLIGARLRLASVPVRSRDKRR